MKLKKLMKFFLIKYFYLGIIEFMVKYNDF